MQSGKQNKAERERLMISTAKIILCFPHLRCGIIFFLDTITLVFLMPIMVVGIIDTAMESVGTLSLYFYMLSRCAHLASK